MPPSPASTKRIPSPSGSRRGASNRGNWSCRRRRRGHRAKERGELGDHAFRGPAEGHDPDGARAASLPTSSPGSSMGSLRTGRRLQRLGPRSATTTWFPPRSMSRRTMLPPIFPRPTKPSCMAAPPRKRKRKRKKSASRGRLHLRQDFLDRPCDRRPVQTISAYSSLGDPTRNRRSPPASRPALPGRAR